LINNEEKSYIPNIAERVEINFNKKVDENNIKIIIDFTINKN